MFFRHDKYIHSSRPWKQNLFAENISSWQNDILVVIYFPFKIKSLFRELSNRDPPAEVRTLKLNFSLTRLFDVDKQESRNSRILVGNARERGFLLFSWRRQSNREAKAGTGIHQKHLLAVRAADFRLFLRWILRQQKTVCYGLSLVILAITAYYNYVTDNFDASVSSRVITYIGSSCISAFKTSDQQKKICIPVPLTQKHDISTNQISPSNNFMGKFYQQSARGSGGGSVVICNTIVRSF